MCIWRWELVLKKETVSPGASDPTVESVLIYSQPFFYKFLDRHRHPFSDPFSSYIFTVNSC